jgi:hypothetical protein
MALPPALTVPYRMHNSEQFRNKIINTVCHNKMDLRGEEPKGEASSSSQPPPPPVFKPFKIVDMVQFNKSLRYYRTNQRGWGLELVESLGLMDTNVGMPGGCLGCYFWPGVLTWILEAVTAVTHNTKTVFLGDFVVRMQLASKKGLFGEPQTFSWELQESGKLALNRVLFLFRNSDSLETVVAYSKTVGLQPNQSHACMVTFTIRGSGRIVINWVDPSAPQENGQQIAEAIRDYLRLRSPWNFVIEFPGCQGPQTISAEPKGTSREPAGYCMTWTNIMILYAVATDGATPSQVMSELESMYPNEKARFMLNFTRIVSRNAARFVKDLNPQDCPDFPCCKDETYCSESQ